MPARRRRRRARLPVLAALTTLGAGSVEADAGPATTSSGTGAVDVLGFVELRNPDDRFPPDRRRRLARATSHPGRLRPGIDVHRQRRNLLLRRRVRSLPPAHRPHRQGPRGADRDTRSPRPRERVVEAPDAGEPPLELRVRGDGRLDRPALPLPEPRASDQRRARQTRHPIFEFDLRRGHYTGRRFVYRADPPVPPEQAHVIGDMTALDRHRLLVIERDFLQAPPRASRRCSSSTCAGPTRPGALVKREVLDLLDVRDPALISLPGRPGDYGLGDPFKFP